MTATDQRKEYESAVKEIEEIAREMKRTAKRSKDLAESRPGLDVLHHDLRAALDRAAWIAEEEL